MKKLIIFALLALLLPMLAMAAPDEAFGRVSNIVDGDTIDVQLQQHNSLVSGDSIRVRFADIDCPEMSTTEGPTAKEYTTRWLQNAQIYLDIDNNRRTDNYGRYVAVVYLANPDGSLNESMNFNRMLVDAKQACIWDFSDNEFHPADWWGGRIPADACIKSDSSTSSTGSTRLGGSSTTGTDIFSSKQSSSSGYDQSTQSYAASDGPFVGSAKSDKYHYPSCSAAKKIKSSNLVTFSSSTEARAAGYVPCGICHPP